MDFSKYKMNLSYVSPSGYPVVLDYKKVEIDDTNTFLWLFSDDATFNEFKVAGQTHVIRSSSKAAFFT